MTCNFQRLSFAYLQNATRQSRLQAIFHQPNLLQGVQPRWAHRERRPPADRRHFNLRQLHRAPVLESDEAMLRPDAHRSVAGALVIQDEGQHRQRPAAGILCHHHHRSHHENCFAQIWTARVGGGKSKRLLASHPLANYYERRRDCVLWWP